MTSSSTTSIISTETNTLLRCGNDIAQMKQAVDQLYKVFLQYSHVTIDDQNDPNIFLSTGKAISPSQAAHCLLEMKRTAIFLRGINGAVQLKMAEKPGAQLNILYAGTGPYAALVTPLLALYDQAYIKVDLLEINPVSLKSAIGVLNGLGFGGFVGETFCADASTFSVNKHYDIVISETMQAALKKEPQVAIMQNLIPQLDENAIFIPEQITVDAALVSRGTWNTENYITENIGRIELGRVITVDRHHLRPGQLRGTVQLTNYIGACNTLRLFTTVHVFGMHVLGENDCSLNIPYKLMDATGMEGETLNFWYEQGDVPHLCCRSAQSSNLFRAIGRPDRRSQPLTLEPQ
jgi:predicted RNA methylase